MEIAAISQCVFCGSYHLFVLDEIAVDVRFLGPKVTRSAIHELESEEILKLLRRRCCRQRTQPQLPCGTCAEAGSGDVRLADLEQDPEFLKRPIGLTPQVFVVFEYDRSRADANCPPAYRSVNGKFILREGVGPQVLETFTSMKNGSCQPWRLPAGQFKVLLPGKVWTNPGLAERALKDRGGADAKGGKDKGKGKTKTTLNANPHNRVAEFLQLYWRRVEEGGGGEAEERGAFEEELNKNLLDRSLAGHSHDESTKKETDPSTLHVRRPLFCNEALLEETIALLQEQE